MRPQPVKATRPKTDRRRTVKISIVDQLFRPRQTEGVNFGAAAWRIVVHDERSLLWVPGFTYWASTLNPRAYSPAELVLMAGDGANDLHKRVNLKTEGRLSRRVLTEHMAVITQTLGVPTRQVVEFTNAVFTAMTYKRTVLLEDA